MWLLVLHLSEWVHVHLSPWRAVLWLLVVLLLVCWEEALEEVAEWVSSLLLVLLWHWEQVLEQVTERVDLLVLVVLNLVLWWLEHGEWVSEEVLVVGLLVVLGSEKTVELLPHVLDGVLDLELELGEESLEGIDEVSEVWEHQGELVDSLE